MAISQALIVSSNPSSYKLAFNLTIHTVTNSNNRLKNFFCDGELDITAISTSDVFYSSKTHQFFNSFIIYVKLTSKKASRKLLIVSSIRSVFSAIFAFAFSLQPEDLKIKCMISSKASFRFWVYFLVRCITAVVQRFFY